MAGGFNVESERKSGVKDGFQVWDLNIRKVDMFTFEMVKTLEEQILGWELRLWFWPWEESGWI